MAGPVHGFEGLADSLDELVFIWRLTGEMLWVNGAFERETGMGVADFGFRNADNPFIHPEDLAATLAALETFVASEDTRSAPIENRFFDAWGRVRALRSIVTKIVWEGAPALLLVSTLQHRPQEASSAELGFRRLVESLREGIVKLADRERILFANRSFHTMTSLSAVELAKQPFSALFVGSDRVRIAQAVADVEAGATASLGVGAKLACGDGSYRDVVVDIDVLDQTGVERLLVVVRDVTDARRLEESLRQQQKLESIGALAGGVAHDINNIVTGVLANADLAASLVPADSPVRALLEDVITAGRRATTLSRSLLAYAGLAPSESQLIDLDDIIDDTLRIARPLAPPDVTLTHARSPGGSPRVEGDPGQLAQVVLNLVTNAVDAIGPRHGHVTVAVELETISARAADDRWMPAAPLPGSYVGLRVIDDGSGIAEHVRARIFDPFFSTKSVGRGLGLAALLGVVRRHGGAISVDSTVGQGTTFTVLLPRAPQPTSAPHTPAPDVAAPPSASGGTVLVIDDDGAIRRIVARVLDAAGYASELAENGTVALALFSATPERFAAAIVDHTMPGPRGPEVIAKLRALRPSLPIIHASGFRDTATAELPPDVVTLPKPFDAVELVEAIRTALTRKPG
ncbi:MAG: ATP-binding protein [Kofleriaceae bacterium]|nr:ATP-binding protein [Kofleriaceae bacterium]